MRFSKTAVASLATTASAGALKGFNYGATHDDAAGTAMTLNDFQTLFANAQKLPGVTGFTSARLYTSIQAGTVSDMSEAFEAAINTKTQLLLGIWASAGDDVVNNELSAINAAITKWNTTFTDLVVGVSVGSEDLYRDSEIGHQANNGAGAGKGVGPLVVANYITQVKSALAGKLTAPVGHVDTWTSWVNSSISAVSTASDFIGMDAYPYFQSTMANDISVAKSLFDSAWLQTQQATGKEVWITETGWPVSGPQSNQAAPNTDNAKIYWDQVGCLELFDKVNTFWFTIQDAVPNVPAPSFGIVASGTTPLFDLSCSNVSAPASSSSVSANPTATGSASPTTMTEATTFTDSAGQTVATTMTVVSNGTTPNDGSPGVSGGAPTGGSGSGSGSGPSATGNVPTGPTASSTAGVATGAAAVSTSSMSGLIGALVAVLALF